MASCVNEAIRTEQGAAALAMPECRAYEMVTPPNEHPNLVNSDLPVVNGGPGSVEAEASAIGGAVAFQSWYSPSGAPSSGHMFRSIRNENGWSTKALQPPLGPQKATCLVGSMQFTVDLQGEVLDDIPLSCSAFEPPLAVGESRTSNNLLVHEDESAPYELLNRLPEGVTAPTEEAIFQAASQEMSHVVFSEEAKLLPEAPAGDGLYEWDEGAVRLITYTPNGAPVQGVMAARSGHYGGFGQAPGMIVHSVSSDGERVVFEANGALYLRENAGQVPSAIVPGSLAVNGEQCSEPANACTVQLDVSHGSGASGSGVFWRASVGGARIFFTDTSRLTSNSTAAASKPDLYEYVAATGQLTDLTVDATEPADVQGVAGASEDGAYVYFVADGVLTGQGNSQGESAQAGEPNLYVHHDGVTSFIATPSRYDRADWGVNAGASGRETEQALQSLSSETSPDGLWLAFNSIAPLTGYASTPAEPKDCEGTTAHEAIGEPCDEIFAYNAAADRLSCVSCGAPGTQPTGQAELRDARGTFARRSLSADGSVFFDTPTPLLGQDTNGVSDVYEWSPAGVGDCTEASTTFTAQSAGCLYPISSGTSPEPSYFADASESGEDAYFLTGQGLVQADTDNALSLYDARVNGGFPASTAETVQEPICASAEACKPPASEAPAQLFPASSVTLVGGNLAAAAVPVTPSPPSSTKGMWRGESGTGRWLCALTLLCAGLLLRPAPALATAPPSFGHQQVLATTDMASAEAQIDPHGLASTCAVQYASEAAFAASGWAAAGEQPCFEALGSGEGERTGLAELSGLSIATTYRYRFVASNQAGNVTGPEGTFVTFGVESFALTATGLGGEPFAQAGGHPYELTTQINLATNPGEYVDGGGHAEKYAVTATLKDVDVQVPAGLIGDPSATPRCAQSASEAFLCSPEEQIGTMYVEFGGIEESGQPEGIESPLFNIVAPEGDAARFSARFNNFANAVIDVHLRSGSDYGVDADSLNITSLAPIRAITVRMWGVPADPRHTPQRACPNNGSSYSKGCASQVPQRPFLSMPTACAGPSTATVSVDAYQQPGAFTPPVSDQMPAVMGCGQVGFEPTFQARPTSDATDSPTGLNVDLHVPQNEEPEGLSSADLKDAMIAFPPGLVVDPSSADGLGACSEAQIGFTGFAELNKATEPGVQTPQFTPTPAECPAASKLGTVQVNTPLLEHPVPGSLYLARQGENPFGSLLAVYLTLHDPISGVVAKIPGMLTADPQTGQLTATFDQNPQLPFEDLKVSLFEGSRAALTTPNTCGSYRTTTTLVPWTSPEGANATPASSFTVGESPSDGACPASETEAPNTPGFEAGMASPVAGSFSPFVLTLSREDGSQRFGALGVTLPPGLIGKVAGVEECPQADIEAAQRRDHEGEGAAELANPSCPAGSELGTVHVGAGSGAPLYVTGKAYFAGPYEGAPFSLVIVTPALAGPFDLGTVVVRAALYIDPLTAQVTVKSDPFPSILDGIPLDIRSVAVDVSRPGFMLNPTSCAASAVTGQETSMAGETANLSDRFQAGGCTNLPFKPSLAVFASGRVSHLDGTSVQFKLSYPADALGKEAWLRAAKFEFPKQLSARLGTIQKSCPAATFADDPAGCPSTALIGTATVKTQLLPVALAGPVYFVSNGGQKFPEAVFVLQGDGVTVDLHSETFINETTGVTSATLPAIPGVPFEEATVTLPAGPYSEFTGIGNLCKPTETVTVKKKVTVRSRGHNRKVTRNVKETVTAPLAMPTGFIGQNGATVSQNTPVTVTGCAKAKAAVKHRRTAKKSKQRHAGRRARTGGQAGRRGKNAR